VGLSPPVTGSSPEDALRSRLESLEATRDQASVLAKARRSLDRFDSEDLGIAPCRDREIATDLEALASPPNPAKLFQIELLALRESGYGPSCAPQGGEARQGETSAQNLAAPKTSCPLHLSSFDTCLQSCWIAPFYRWLVPVDHPGRRAGAKEQNPAGPRIDLEANEQR
jgi:hypothetical protein